MLAVILGLALGVATAWLRLAYDPWDGNPLLGEAKSPVNRSFRPEEPAPKLVIDQSKFDFGTMDIEEKGSHKFLVKNSGNSPLTIREKDTSCNCVVGDIEKKEIPPGESAKITITWKSKQVLGPFSEMAMFSTNDPVQSELSLTISGQIIAKLRADPQEFIFHQISTSETATAEARLLCYQDEPWTILGHRWDLPDTAPKFQADFEPLSPEQLKEFPNAKSGYLIKLTLKPGLPLGPFKQTIRLATSLKLRPEMTIPIQGVVTSDIRVAGPLWDTDKDVLDLGVVNSRQGLRQRMLLIVRGPYRKEVKFKTIHNPALPITVSLGETTDINNGKVTQTPLFIEIPKGSRSANYLGEKPSSWGEIKIETTHPEEPIIHLLVRFAVQQ
jgi:hypothetical protein